VDRSRGGKGGGYDNVAEVLVVTIIAKARGRYPDPFKQEFQTCVHNSNQLDGTNIIFNNIHGGVHEAVWFG
nr:hypothetical protein [Tanacetum cinerariifolium]